MCQLPTAGPRLVISALQADDLALAKAMQEQERAFHWLSTRGQPAQPDVQHGTA
jgi:hypothetical protein